MNAKEKIQSSVFGTFFAGAAELALPATSIQEVIDFPNELEAFPLSPDFVLGFLNLRSRIIPVLDSCRLLHLDKGAETYKKIVVISHSGGHIGLAFHDSHEILRLSPDRVIKFDHADETAILAVESVLKLADEKRIIHVLSLARLDSLKQLLQSLGARTENGFRLRASRGKELAEKKQCIAFRMHGSSFALDIATVREIVTLPDMERSLIQNDLCLGVITLREQPVPIVDFSRLLGLSDDGVPTAGKKALILKREGQNFGIVIDSVESIVSYGDDLMPVPVFNEAQATLFKGCIRGTSELDILLLDEAGIYKHATIGEIMDARRNLYRAHEEKVLGLSRSTKDVLITFRLGVLAALPMKDVQEIIPFSEAVIRSPGSKPFVEGVINLRGTLVSIIGLRKLYELPANEDETVEPKILVVRYGAGAIGLMIDSIEGIVTSDKDKKVPVPHILRPKTSPQMAEDLSEVIEPNGDSSLKGAVMIFSLASILDRLNGGSGNSLNNIMGISA